MVVMLVVTATVAAMFALHFTMTDLRSVGEEERKRETTAIAESTLECLISSYEATNYQDLMTEFRATEDLGNLSPTIRVDLANHDVAGNALAACVGTDPDVGNSYGPGRSYVPEVLVEVTDLSVVDAEAGELAGEHADGEGSFVFVSATLNGNAVATPLDAVGSAPGAPSREHALRATSRANILFGPIPR